MIIENGYIQAIIRTGGGLDEDKYPIPTREEYGERIPCNILLNKKNKLASANGSPFVDVNYEVLIEPIPFPHERVRLITQFERVLGDFSVISIEYLEHVRAIQILV